MASSPPPPSDRVRLLLADVDGTLVNEAKELTPAARRAVKRLAEAGIGFAITSGRPPRGMAMLTGPLELTLPLAGFNGGAYVASDLTPLEQHVLDAKIAARAIDQIESDGLDAWVYTIKDWYLRDEDAPHVAKESATVQFGPRVVNDFDGLLDRAVKIVGVSDDLERVAACEAAMRRALGNDASAARSQPYYLDVTHPLANKGDVVAWLSRRLAIPLDEIATIGDMPNDETMFVKSGLSIAMGNASAEVRASAHFTAASYNDDGFAKAVETFILPRAPR
jgi:Cof subfamily protein (haloacid dehalogenase superfamily)